MIRVGKVLRRALRGPRRAVGLRWYALRCFPEPLEAFLRLAEGAGASGAAYRGQSAALTAALPDDRVALLHILRGCTEASFALPAALDLAGLERLAAARPWNRRYLAQIVASLVNAHLTARPASAHDPDFWRRLLPALRRVGRPFLLAGDSHSLLSRSVGGGRRAPTVPVHLLCSAGSAVGLANPASRSGYGQYLARTAAALAAAGGRGLPAFFQFGQVDVEFVSTFRRIARGEAAFDPAAFGTFCTEVVERYGAFLGEHFGRFTAVHVVGIAPPALSDEAWAEGYCNAHVAQLEGDRDEAEIIRAVRSIAVPGLAARTALHRAFNDRLRALCRARGLRYVDGFDALLGPDGTLDRRFLGAAQGRDHHVDPDAAGPLARAAIAAALARAGRGG
ncbi:hypothetical protein OPKNFCMD_0948 [Methylobacterium crusticola]|uniref:Uncharacterized protein n=1 Tax=Methylobacterium crusticola TaxID=1697972 RepID=A0ABQ4QUH0_9HYPH|nr:hypothetical protein [Methylobacterium crusticola]GJD48232.1 hypothetical protein OPKNFCMD_0948 [Methylobacterium crusticola]